MIRSRITVMPEYFEKYIMLVDDIELDEAFENNLRTMEGLDLSRLEELGNKSYAPGKWTVKDIFQHIIDTERVMSYRTLRYARKDGVVPQGYDQELFAENANASKRSVAGLAEELKQLHQATRLMFRSFDEEILQATGINWKMEMSVLAMGFLITGHFMHHMHAIREKYMASW